MTGMIFLKQTLSYLSFQSLLVTLRTTKFNIQKFCMVMTLHLCVLFGSHNKTASFALHNIKR